MILTVDDGNAHTDTDEVTFTVSAPPPGNAAPTARITGSTCANLVCSFTGSTSTDPDGDPLTYSWDFGDDTLDATTQDASHPYASAGSRTVTLTVNDGNGHTHSATTVVNPTAGDPEVSNVTFVGSASTVGNRTAHAVTLPGGVDGINVGDTMVLFLAASSSGRTYTDPVGWTLLESKDGDTAMAGRAWTRTATASDRAGNVRVSVTSSALTKSDLTVAVYRGTNGATPSRAAPPRSITSRVPRTSARPSRPPVPRTGW